MSRVEAAWSRPNFGFPAPPNTVLAPKVSIILYRQVTLCLRVSLDNQGEVELRLSSTELSPPVSCEAADALKLAPFQ